jgi:hypothetical protein
MIAYLVRSLTKLHSRGLLSAMHFHMCVPAEPLPEFFDISCRVLKLPKRFKSFT